jgi:hypothetical protein
MTDDNFQDIPAPSAPATALTTERAVHGPLIPPQQRILLNSASEWEGFVHEWSHFCLKEKYNHPANIRARSQTEMFSGNPHSGRYGFFLLDSKLPRPGGDEGTHAA